MFDNLDYSYDYTCGGSLMPAASDEILLYLRSNRTGCHVLPYLDAPVKIPLVRGGGSGFLILVSLAVSLRRRWGYAWPSVIISRHDKLLCIDITVPSRWKVERGQYAYLWLPQAGLRIASQNGSFL
jgi:hypothetical protein